MFSSPTGFQVRVGTTPQSSGGPAAFSSGYAGSPSRFAPPAGPSLRPQAGAPSAFPQPSNSSFADFAAASPSGGRPNTEASFHVCWSLILSTQIGQAFECFLELKECFLMDAATVKECSIFEPYHATGTSLSSRFCSLSSCQS